MLAPTDILNITCFGILTIVALIGIVLATKMKLPVWKFQVAWISFIEIIGVILLIYRLTNERL